MDDILEKILLYKQEAVIEGICIDFVPFKMSWIDDFIRVRNVDKNRYFFNQSYLLTVESQKLWYEEYARKDNDIYWCVLNKSGKFIGTMRLYNINIEESILTQGSFMIDAEVAGEAPYALEAELMSLDFAFNILKVKKIINENRYDNQVMNNLSKKLGFVFIKDTKVNEVPYKYYILTEENYLKKRNAIFSIIEYWGKR